MRTGLVLLTATIGAIGGACRDANAAELSPSNPLHCAMQFESYFVLATQMGKESEARAYGARAQWYANRARSLPADHLTPDALSRLEKKILAAPDGGLALSTECNKRQEADPEFQRLLNKAATSPSKR